MVLSWCSIGAGEGVQTFVAVDRLISNSLAYFVGMLQVNQTLKGSLHC